MDGHGLFCGSRNIQSHTVALGTAGFRGDLGLVPARSGSHYVVGPADHPFGRCAAAQGAFHIHPLIGAHKKLLILVPAFEASKFKDGHSGLQGL